MPAPKVSPLTMKLISSHQVDTDFINEMMSQALEPYDLGACLPCFPYDFDNNEREYTKPYVPPVQIVGEQKRSSRSGGSANHSNNPHPSICSGSDMILDANQMQEIAQYVLPTAINRRRWKRLYASSRDGNSFLTCMHAIRAEPRTLVVVRTSQGTILGGYADAPWRVRSKFGGIYDNYESVQSCLFSFSSAKRRHMKRADSERSNHSLFALDDRDDSNGSSNNKDIYSSVAPRRTRNPASKAPAICVHKWTGKNRNFQCCDFDRRMLAFGGNIQYHRAHNEEEETERTESSSSDEEVFGLCLEEDFFRGNTRTCDTYDNDPLCDDSVFAIQEVEVWGFLTMVKV